MAKLSDLKKVELHLLLGFRRHFKHNKNLLFYERQQEIDQALEDLKIQE